MSRAMAASAPNLDSWRCVWHIEWMPGPAVALTERDWPQVYPADNGAALVDQRAAGAAWTAHRSDACVYPTAKMCVPYRWQFVFLLCLPEQLQEETR